MIIFRLTPYISLFFISFSFLQSNDEKSDEFKSIDKINFESLSFDHSMKGWELYSWPNGNDWNYSVLIGTNRLKSYEEITANQIAVTGIDSLKMLLDIIPENEEVFWIGEGWLAQIWHTSYGNLSLPNDEIINEIQYYCLQNKLILNIGY